jgi:hypothetical protein
MKQRNFLMRVVDDARSGQRATAIERALDCKGEVVNELTESTKKSHEQGLDGISVIGMYSGTSGA